MVQHPGRSQDAASTGSPPGHGPAHRAPGSGAPLPHGADQAGGQPGALDRDPRGGAGRVPPLASHAALPGAAVGEGPRHASADLLQIRGRQPGGQPQAEHGRGPGLLQQEAGRDAPLHRDRRWPVGVGPRDGLRLLRPPVQGVHGEGVVPPEALPARPDGNLGRPGRPEPEPRHPGRQEDPRAGSQLPRQPRHRDQRGGGGRGHPRGHEVLPRQRAEPRAHAPDDRRPGDEEAARQGRRRGRHPGRLHRGRLQFLGLLLPLRRRQAHRQEEKAPRHRGRADRLPEPHQRQVRLRLRRHGGPHAARQDAYARPHVRPAAAPRRRPPLPRHGGARLQALRRGGDRGGRGPAGRHVPGRHPVRPRRGDYSRPRIGSRDPRRDR